MRTLLIEDNVYLDKVPVRVLKFVEVTSEGQRYLKNEGLVNADNKEKKGVVAGDYEGFSLFNKGVIKYNFRI